MLYVVASVLYILSVFLSFYALTINVKKDYVSLYDHRTIITGALALASLIVFWIASGSFWLAVLDIMLVGIGLIAGILVVTHICMRMKRRTRLEYWGL